MLPDRDKLMEFSPFAQGVIDHKYAHTLADGTKETWENIAYRVTKNVMKSAGYTMRDKVCKEIFELITLRKFIPGGRYLYASGRAFHQVQNCLLMRAEDSREGWSEQQYKASMALMTGAGIGIDYSDIRAEGKIIRKTGGRATGPIALMGIINEAGRRIMQGGSRRSAIWAGLNWNHPDIHSFITLKNWNKHELAGKKDDFNFPATMDGTNISVLLDDLFFEAFHDDEHPLNPRAHDVYWSTVKRMLKTGEPGFSIDVGENKGETLRNACTEVTSSDDSDICNLGSINLARIGSLEEMDRVVELGTMFLLAGTLYSSVPYPKVDSVRNKNRRLGLGIMGVHEWLIQRGKPYAPDDELERYLYLYAGSGEKVIKYAKEWDISEPVKTRAIAPTGSIGIVAETTTGIEPVFCTSYKRRYLKHKTWHYRYVIEPIAKRAKEELGINPDDIEDAYSLAENVEKRVAFQAWVQQYVDHGISSTINLPAWGSYLNNDSRVFTFGEMLIKYLPKLRGITVYPDGAREGQPLTPCKWEEAANNNEEEAVEEQVDICDLTKGGSCGD